MCLFIVRMVLLKSGRNRKCNTMSFSKNVFINCPFDKAFFPLLKTAIFTLKKLGFNPRLALERFDSGEVRFAKIKELIEDSKYGIHDLSRSKSTKGDEYFRLNMPFELGFDLGCRDFHQNKQYRDKKILVLEDERYSTKKALSDISFGDCKCHGGEAEELVFEIRNWFSELGFKNLPSASSIWDDFNIFYSELYLEMKSKGFRDKDIERLPISEFIDYINRPN
jgi:hypothetical protein